MRTDGCCPKCNSSSSFNTYKSMDERIYCECHNPDCKYTGDSVEFMFYQPKMKFSEIKFKVVTCSPQRNQLIVDMVNKFRTTRGVFFCDDRAKAVKITNASLFYYLTQHIDEVEGDAKEVTFEEAIKILESCEPVVKKSSGKFIEYDIDGNGYYNLENGGKINWQEHLVFEIAKGCIFGGWFWEHPEDSIDDGWSLNRQGINRTTRSMTSICEDWEYPLIPKKIRFWVKD